jgi:hypothetical protein
VFGIPLSSGAADHVVLRPAPTGSASSSVSFSLPEENAGRCEIWLGKRLIVDVFASIYNIYKTTHSGSNIGSNIELHAVPTKYFDDMASH